MEEVSEQQQQRREKLEEFKARGIDPYVSSFSVTATSGLIKEKFEKLTKEELEKESSEFIVAGRIITRRSHGKTTFIHLQDSDGQLQIYIRKDEVGEESFETIKKLDIGDIIGVKGKVFKTNTGELTIHSVAVTLLSKSLRPLPEKWHGLKDIEIRYRQRYVDLIVNPEVKEVFKIRSKVVKSIRTFLDDRGYMEVETPMMQVIPGGATAKPFKTHHNALGIDLYLRIAPELYLKRLVVGSMERVYEINRNFRNEGISTMHNPEFTMVEFYTAYVSYEDLMPLTEELFLFILEKSIGKTEVVYGEHTLNFSGPWKRYAFYEALKDVGGLDLGQLTTVDSMREYAKSLGISLGDAANDKGKLLDKLFSHAVEGKLIQPTFITDYPIELSPLAKRRVDDPSLVQRFELFIAGREIANAYTELNDPIDQKSRFEEQSLKQSQGDDEAHSMDDDFIRALEYGMPPTAGEGIGIDRLVMLLTNAPSIRDVILFPHMKPVAGEFDKAHSPALDTPQEKDNGSAST